MKRRNNGIAVLAIAVGLTLLFFYVPTFYWFTNDNMGTATTLYRSAGCSFFGTGDIYGTPGMGFRWGCESPGFS